MDKLSKSFAILVLLAFSLCCVPLVAIAGDVSGAWQAIIAKIQTEKLEAQAEADKALSVRVVAQGQAEILEQAARSVAADRNLVTLYAVSSNGAILAGVAASGVIVGFLAGKRRKVNHD